LALETGIEGGLLSPFELRDIIDTSNSWAVGACVDVARISRLGPPGDWIRVLNRRVSAVRVNERRCSEGSATALPLERDDLADTVAALNDIQYEHPLIVSVDGQPCTNEGYSPLLAVDGWRHGEGSGT
jgi:hexulose-6-phosphate isomerase